MSVTKHSLKFFKVKRKGTSLALQWSGLCLSAAGGTDLIPGCGTKILHAMQCGPAILHHPPPQKGKNIIEASVLHTELVLSMFVLKSIF